jgi:hypothetical protein
MGVHEGRSILSHHEKHWVSAASSIRGTAVRSRALPLPPSFDRVKLLSNMPRRSVLPRQGCSSNGSHRHIRVWNSWSSCSDEHLPSAATPSYCSQSAGDAPRTPDSVRPQCGWRQRLPLKICPSSAECTGAACDQLWRCNTSSSAERHVKTVGKLLEV